MICDRSGLGQVGGRGSRTQPWSPQWPVLPATNIRALDQLRSTNSPKAICTTTGRGEDLGVGWTGRG